MNKEKYDNNKPKKSKNIHAKHRQRMWDKYQKFGLDSFAEHEVIEMLLYLAYPMKDVNAKAHRLLDKFGSLENIINSSTSDLMKPKDKNDGDDILNKNEDDSLTFRAAAILTLFRSVDNYIRNRSAENDKIVLATSKVTGEYCCRHFGGNTKEVLNMIVVDGNRKVKHIVNISSGTDKHTDVNIEAIMLAVLQLKASGVILCHNHPGGNAYPSNEDITATNTIGAFLAGINVPLIDHIVCCNDKYVSLADRQLLMY